MYKFKRDGKTILAESAPPSAWIEEMLKGPGDFGYYGDNEAMGKTWAIGPVLEHRDSGLLDRANAQTLLKLLASDPSLENDYEIMKAGHWAVGHCQHLNFRVLEDDGSPSRISTILYAWFDYLANHYPIADEDLYSNMVWDATMENLDQETERVAGAKGYTLPEDWHFKMVDWFDENRPSVLENEDDQGGWPNEEDLLQAFEDLGFKKEE